MCWRMVFLAGAIAVAAFQFNPHDNSDFIDSIEDEISVSRESETSTEGKTKDPVQGEIEKLLGQPIINYEDPVAAVKVEAESTNSPDMALTSSSTSPNSTSTATTQSHKKTSYKGLRDHSIFKRKSPRPRHRTSDVIYSVRVPRWDDSYPQVGEKFRPGVIESIVDAHNLHRYEVLPLPARPTLTDFRPTLTDIHPTLTDSSIIGRTDESPTRTFDISSISPTAYNEGGTRVRQTLIDANGRRQYLLEIPENLLTTTKRRPRPTPVSRPLVTAYQFTRRTRRHPNCTDSYYECLELCFDNKGYRVKCPWDTPPPRPEPARLNFTGMFWAILKERRMTEYDTSDLFRSWRSRLIDKGYRSCRTFASKTTTTTPRKIIYYDDALSKQTGTIVAKCWVCGLMDYGIPDNANCYDNFANTGFSLALAEKASYRRYCRYMDEVPLWFNRSDPYSVWGTWTGGCSYRFLDLSGMYTQRTCRSLTYPATGQHFLSKRMARLELALRDQAEGCVVSPMATLVPFSRAISLYARFHVCVCRGSWCNRQCRHEPGAAALAAAVLLTYYKSALLL